jgi:hypothetical protein
VSYARAGSSPAFGTIYKAAPDTERLVRPWPGALSPAFGTIYKTGPDTRKLVRHLPGE